MENKLRRIQFICNIVGFLALIISLISAIAIGITTLSVITAIIASIAFAVKLVAEIITVNEQFIISIFFMMGCIVLIPFWVLLMS